MKSSRLEKDKKMEDNIIKDVRKPFRFKKEVNNTTVKYIRNLFRLKKGNKAIKISIIRDIKNRFQHEEEDYYKPVRAGNFLE